METPLFPGAETWGMDAVPPAGDRTPAAGTQAAPPLSVATLLAIDEEYRARASAGTLPRLTFRRFNPQATASPPMLRSERDGWTVRALYSNSWRAHQFGRTQDWVVIHYERAGEHGQATVVTETRGRLRGQRVVRGRELESLRVHEAAASPRRLAG